MASMSEEDLSCPVCHEIFKEAVMLSCSHSFCKDCVLSWWTGKEDKECPVCKRKHSREDVNPSSASRNLERGQTPSEDLCSLHSEKLKFFCLAAQQPVCDVCIGSGKPSSHMFRPIQETAQEYRQLVLDTLDPYLSHLHHLLQVKEKFDQSAEHIQVQARHTERQIKEQFKKLHQFLEEEKEARLSALREEEEQKSQRMKEQMEALSRDIAALSHTVRDTEDELRAGDVAFLVNYPNTAHRLQQLPLVDGPEVHSPHPEDTKLPSGALIDVAKHLGNLSFNIWNKMKDMVSYSPVILDPNTAGSKLVLSDDLTSVSPGDQQQLPENPEREGPFSVQGCEIFNPGTHSTHSWDMEVEGCDYWEVGLKDDPLSGPSWKIRFSDGFFETGSISFPDTVLSVQDQIQRVRVSLDWDRGELSFSDPDADRHIHTFTHTFPQRVIPVITYVSENPVRILPQKVSVRLGLQ